MGKLRPVLAFYVAHKLETDKANCGDNCQAVSQRFQQITPLTVP